MDTESDERESFDDGGASERERGFGHCGVWVGVRDIDLCEGGAVSCMWLTICMQLHVPLPLTVKDNSCNHPEAPRILPSAI